MDTSILPDRAAQRRTMHQQLLAAHTRALRDAERDCASADTFVREMARWRVAFNQRWVDHYRAELGEDAS